MANAADDVLLHYLSWFEGQKVVMIVFAGSLGYTFITVCFGSLLRSLNISELDHFFNTGFFLSFDSTDWHAVFRKRGRQNIISWEADDVAVYGAASGTLSSVLGMTVCSSENLVCKS